MPAPCVKTSCRRPVRTILPKICLPAGGIAGMVAADAHRQQHLAHHQQPAFENLRQGIEPRKRASEKQWCCELYQTVQNCENLLTVESFQRRSPLRGQFISACTDAASEISKEGVLMRIQKKLCNDYHIHSMRQQVMLHRKSNAF